MANRINSVKITSPYDLLEKCAQMELEDVPVNYVFPDITRIGKIYTLTFHVKAESDCTMYIGEETIPVSTDWKRVSFVFTALEKTLKFEFRERGIYYFFNTQLEEGNKATPYRPAPEDITVENIYVPDTKEIDGGKIYVESIRAGAIAAEAIETRHIAANAIIANHINAGAVTAEKLTVGTGGNLYNTYDIFAQLRDGVDSKGVSIQNIYFQKSETATVSLTDEIKGYYGDKVLKIQSSGSDTHVYLGHSETRYGCVSVVPGGNYFISMYVRCDRGTSSASFEVCEHERQDAVVTNQIKCETTEIDSKWKRISYKYTAGDDCSYISLRINHEGASGSSIYVDAIQIERVLHTVTEPSDFKPAGTVVIDGGNIVANSITSAKIGAEQILANHIVGNAIDASKIKAGTLEALWIEASTLVGGVLQSSNYTGYGSDGYATAGFIVNLAGQEIRAKNFKILADGSAYLKGRIEASKGKIANFNIETNYIATSNVNSLAGAANSVYLGTSGISCGTQFKVTNAGELTATNANITGTITATYITATTAGNIAGWGISEKLMTRTMSGSGNTVNFGDMLIEQNYSYGNSYAIMNLYNPSLGFVYALRDDGALWTGPLVRINNPNGANNRAYGSYSELIVQYGGHDRIGFRAGDSSTELRLYGSGGGAILSFSTWGTITANGNVAKAIVSAGSDRRLKNIHELLSDRNMLSILKKVNVYEFDYINDSHSVIHYGIVAQELRDVLINDDIGYIPILDIERSLNDESDPSDLFLPEESVTYRVNYTEAVPVLWKGWQYHDEQISVLDTQQIQLQTQLDHALQEIEKLKNEIKELKTA